MSFTVLLLEECAHYDQDPVLVGFGEFAEHGKGLTEGRVGIVGRGGLADVRWVLRSFRGHQVAGDRHDLVVGLAEGAG